MLKLADKDFKAVTITITSNVKENILWGIKKVYEEKTKKNQMEILEFNI